MPLKSKSKTSISKVQLTHDNVTFEGTDHEGGVEGIKISNLKGDYVRKSKAEGEDTADAAEDEADIGFKVNTAILLSIELFIVN